MAESVCENQHPWSQSQVEDAAVLSIMGPALRMCCEVAAEAGKHVSSAHAAPEGHRLLCGDIKLDRSHRLDNKEKPWATYMCT